VKIWHALVAILAAALSALGLALPTDAMNAIRHGFAASFHPSAIGPILAALFIAITGCHGTKAVSTKVKKKPVRKAP
jgi:hypothetical protein